MKYKLKVKHCTQLFIYLNYFGLGLKRIRNEKSSSSIWNYSLALCTHPAWPTFRKTDSSFRILMKKLDWWSVANCFPFRFFLTLPFCYKHAYLISCLTAIYFRRNTPGYKLQLEKVCMSEGSEKSRGESLTGSP